MIPDRLTKSWVEEFLMHDYNYEPLERDFMEMVRTGKDKLTGDWLLDGLDDSCNMTTSTSKPARVGDIVDAELYVEGNSLAVVANSKIGGGNVRVKTAIRNSNNIDDLIITLAIKFIEAVGKTSRREG
jgi:hypothetical protein